MAEPMHGSIRVAGLWCHEVLDRLGDYVDGALGDDDVARVRGHVAECQRCERFGAAYGALVARVRDDLARDAASPDLLARVRRQLA